MQQKDKNTENIFSEKPLPPINNRVRELIEHYASGSVKKFSEIAGLASSQKLNRIFNVDKRNNEYPEVSSDILLAIANKFSDTSLDWLLTGRGEMIKDIKKSLSSPPIARPAHKPGEGIPLIPIDAMAGALAGEMSVLEHECDRYVVPVFKGADFLIPVKGSSMYPKYSSGDIVACKRIPMDKLFFQWNKVYVIDTDQGALIKRIKPGNSEEHVLIVSDNDNYEPFELPYSAIYSVALVIGVIRLE